MLMQQFFDAVLAATGDEVDRATWDGAGFVQPDGAPVILDVGCGMAKCPGSLGVDLVAVSGVDIVADFTRGLPFRDSSVDGIYTSHTLEHAENLLPVMEELWRVCKPHAAVYARGPHAACPYTTWSDPTHRRGLTLETFRYFGERHYYNFYTKARFELTWGHLNMRLVPERERQGWARRLLTRVLERFANRNGGAQYRCERWWGPWVGIEEIHVLLRALK